MLALTLCFIPIHCLTDERRQPFMGAKSFKQQSTTGNACYLILYPRIVATADSEVAPLFVGVHKCGPQCNAHLTSPRGLAVCFDAQS